MGLAILLVEDDPTSARALARFLQKEGHHLIRVETGEEGVRLFLEQSPDLVLLDLKLPGIGGLEVLEQIKKLDEAAAVIVTAAHGSIETAVEAMRLGAMDFVTKPIDLEALCLKLDQTGRLLGLRSDLGYLLDRERRGGTLEDFIGGSPAMQLVYEKIREAAETDNTSVLVTGPSGAGKKLAARAIHSLSARGKKPLMQIDCTAFPPKLLESELFGHERGAFTGADRMKKGLLELADGGTLLLDEIGDMDVSLQGKFLHVLQERQFRRVGGTRDLRFGVRVIAATDQDLDDLCCRDRFRRDLLRRLKVFQIDLPPLNERGEDVLELGQAFVQQHARSFRKPVHGLDEQARRALMGYSFPGNVRELGIVIKQAVILARGEVITRDLLSIPDPADRRPVCPGAAGAAGLSIDALGENPLKTAEIEIIKQALIRSGGKKNRAAELLGISRFALQRKLEKFAIEIPEKRKR